MIKGFAFRDPSVIRMMLDRVKFAGFVIPVMDSSNRHVAAYQAAMKEPVGHRVRVFLVSGCRTLCNLVTQIKDFDYKNSAYFVFDSASILHNKTCVSVVDTDSTTQPVWQYMKSTPANLNMQVTSGISQDDLTCLGMMPENPEDRVKSDQRRDKKTPKASFVLISDLLKAILDRPELSSNKTLAMHLIAMYLTGKFVKPFERKVTKRNILSVGICNVKTYKALTYEYEAFDRLVNAGLKLGINFERCESRLLPIKALPEFSIIMRVFLLIDQGHAMDKACAMVGASTSTIAMIATALQPPSLASTTKWAANTVAFPQHTVTRSIAYEQHVEYIDKQRATPTERIEVPAGTYRMDAMLRICKLLGSSETTANQKHLTTAVPETNAIKVLLSAGGYGYKIIAGENYFVRYRGKRVPVAGISASKD